MPAKTLLPPPYLTLEDINGATITGGTVTFLETGTAVLAVVYADANGTVISANPLTVDGAARYTVFLTPGQVVDVEYRDENGTLVKTVPAVQAIPSASGNVDLPGTFGEAVTAGQVVYLSDGSITAAGRWWLAVGTDNRSSALPTIGVALVSGPADSTGTIRTAGHITDLTGLVVGATYYVSNTPGALALTPATQLRLVGQADTTTSLVLWANPREVLPIVDQPTPSGTVLQLVVTPGTHTTRIIGTGLVTIHGIQAGYDGQRLRILNIGGTQVDFVYMSPSAASVDRLFNWVLSGPTSLVAGFNSAIEYEYDGSQNFWRLVYHEQGGWITPPFNAADYTGAGGMTWTVAAGNVSTCAYYLRGKVLQVQFAVNATVLGGVASAGLQRIMPGGYSTTMFSTGPVVMFNGAAVTTGPTWQTSGATMLFSQDLSSSILFVLGTGTYIWGTMTIAVE